MLLRIRYLFVLLTVFSLFIIFPIFPEALTQQEERKGLTGAHSILSCSNCHIKEVWHSTSINSTVCKTCHPNVWDLVLSNKHNNLLFNGNMSVTNGDLQVRYCDTCHNPHHPDVLRLTYLNGTAIHIPFTENSELCLTCHDL